MLSYREHPCVLDTCWYYYYICAVSVSQNHSSSRARVFIGEGCSAHSHRSILYVVQEIRSFALLSLLCSGEGIIHDADEFFVLFVLVVFCVVASGGGGGKSWWW